MLGFDALGRLALGQAALDPPRQGTFAPLFTNTNTFYAATVSASYGLTPAVFTDGDTFYSPSVDAAGIDTLVPDLFANTNTFYAATVTPGGVSLTVGLLDEEDTFFPPSLVLSNALLPPLVSLTDTFFTAIVAGGEDAPPARGGFGVVFPRMTTRATLRTGSSGPVVFTRIN